MPDPLEMAIASHEYKTSGKLFWAEWSFFFTREVKSGANTCEGKRKGAEPKPRPLHAGQSS